MQATPSKRFTLRVSSQVLFLRTFLLGAGACVATGAFANDAADTETAAAPALDEIVVTATRREENISRVPISITAMSQEMLDTKGIKDFADVARFTPGVSFDTSQTNQISIRGINSSGGSGTTGIYIDDVPIQVRALGFNSDDALLKIFDLDRVEILRGPQGTLFGAGSEGGTVRYITTQPSLTKTSAYAKTETSYTQGGDLSYEAGVAAGTPVIDGVLGVRASAWYRRDGGWIDRIDPTTLQTVDKNANHVETSVLRVAALWQPSDAVRVSPSILYQDSQRNDVTIYWPQYSDPSKDRYFSANPTGRTEPDTLWLPSINIQADFGAVRLISTSAYFNRHEVSGYDGTLYNLGYYQTLGIDPTTFPLLDGSGVHLPPGLQNYRAPTSVTNQQDNWTQEFRLQSTDPTARLQWTAGVFYSLDRQFSLEEIHDPMADQLFNQLLGENIATFFGTPLNPDGSSYLPMGDSYFNRLVSHDRQLAGFGELNFNLTDTLKLTAGVRVSRTTFNIESLSGGPQNSGPRPGTQQNTETPVTPKAGIEWQADPNDLYYFTFAKGFRSGGGNPSIPYDPTFQNPAVGCTQDFLNFGIPHAPATYKSDSVKSFEVGAKNNFNNRIRLASSIYYIRWNDIQGNVVPPICQIQWTDNLGDAISKGFDVQADFQVTTALSVESSFGYTDARYTKNAFPSGAIVTGPNPPLPLVAAGDAVAGPNGIGTGYSIPPYSATIGVEYKFQAFGHESFMRGDYEYLAGDKWVHANLDSNTSSYDPTGLGTERQVFASLRAGTNLGGWIVSGFVDNLTDSHPILNFNHQTNSYDANGVLLASPAYRFITYRPRTFGITATFKY
ncbi:MAG TPA: TonB-dependent receptor [Steroidobacteraceae bacterium]|nr:TonB-dependent receptor [Steroidobacteraceae bacterium]